MLFAHNVSRTYIITFFLIVYCTNLFSQNDFTLEDINPDSDTFGELIGPSYFTDNVLVLGFFHEYWGTCRARFELLNDLYLELLSENILDVKFIGIGKDQYSSSLDGMLNGRILPWVQDNSSDGYPVWSEYGASQRDVFFINNEGFIDTSFSITTYSPSSIEDVDYIKNIILEIKNTSLSINDNLKPELFTLLSNYPNPFNPTTNIAYDLSKNSFVNISIFDIDGKKVRTLLNRFQSEGYNTIIWNGKNDSNVRVAAGMYLYTLLVEDMIQTRKMVMLK